MTNGETIKAAVQEGGEWVGTYAYVAVRVVDAVPVDGETLAPSRVWVDGEATDDLLDGTCGLSLAHAERLAAQYVGRVVLVMGGDDASWGEDVGEVIIRDAMALAAWVDGARIF